MQYQRFLVLAFLLIDITLIRAQKKPGCLRGTYLSGNKCLNCPRGTYLSGNKCLSCPVGTYRTGRVLDGCSPCPKGTYNPHERVGTKQQCRPCPANTYSDTPGAVSCKPCPKGLASLLGATVCLKCGPGTRPAPYDFVFQQADPKCVACKPGSYSSGSANQDCTKCPSGLSNKEGSTSISDCKPCPAGKQMAHYHPSGCAPCSSGTFKSKPLPGYCPSCPDGFIAEKEMGSKRCIPCPVGTRSNARNDACMACPKGFGTRSTGNRICRLIGGPCPPLSFETKSGDCKRCKANEFVTDNQICKPCPRGSRSLRGNSRKCIKCPAGQQAEYDGSVCKCGAGMYSEASGKCVKCPPGTFANEEWVGVEPGRCTPCFDGTIAPRSGSLECVKCADGLVPNENRTRCVSCPGKYTIEVPAYEDELPYKCVNITTGCLPGYRRNDINNSCVKKLCNMDTPKEEIGVTCLPCPKGRAYLGDGKKCVRCPRGYVSPGGMVTQCTKCENGKLADFLDKSKCTCGKEGRGIIDGLCQPCPKGYAAKFGQEVCTACKPGTFAIGRGSVYCENCRKGTFKSKSGPGNCKLCPEGQVGNMPWKATKCFPLMSD